MATTLKTNVKWDYVVTNELKKIIWKRSQWDNSLIYMSREKKKNPLKNDYDMDFSQYGPFQTIQKLLTFFWLGIF